MKKIVTKDLGHSEIVNHDAPEFVKFIHQLTFNVKEKTHKNNTSYYFIRHYYRKSFTVRLQRFG